MAGGNFSVDVAVSSHVPLVRVHALVQGPVPFEVVDSFDGDSARGDYMGEYPGVVRPDRGLDDGVPSHGLDGDALARRARASRRAAESVGSVTSAGRVRGRRPSLRTR